MKLNITKIVIITISFITLTRSSELEITRVRPKGRNGWMQGRDLFQIKLSLPTRNSRNNNIVNCARFSAEEISQSGDQFTCSCSSRNATLMLANDEWRCLKNVHVRKLLGSTWHFENEGQDDALRILTNSESRRVKVPWFWFYCGVDKYKSWYIGCNGSEIPLTGDLQLFTIQRGYNHNFPYFLKVNRGSSNADLLNGRIIKLGIQCTDPTNNALSTSALLFKYEGKVNCKFSFSFICTDKNTMLYRGGSLSTPTSQPVVSTKSFRTIFPSETPTTETTPKTTSTAKAKTLQTSTIAKTKATPKITEIFKKDTKTTIKATARPSLGREQRVGKNSSTVALIAGLSSSVLVIVIVIVLLIYRRFYSGMKLCAKNETLDKKETAVVSGETSSAHEPEIDDENIYKELELREPVIYQMPIQRNAAQRADGDSHENHVYESVYITKEGNFYGPKRNEKTADGALEASNYYETTDIKIQPCGPFRVDYCEYNVREVPSLAPLQGSVEGPDDYLQPVDDAFVKPYAEVAIGNVNYGFTSMKGTVDNELERPANLHGVQSVYNVLDEPYAESAEERSHHNPVALAIDEPIYSIVDESHIYGIHSNADSDGTYEPIYITIEEEPREGIMNKTQ